MRARVIWISLIAGMILPAALAAAAQATTEPADPAARAYSAALGRLSDEDRSLVRGAVLVDATGVHLLKSASTRPAVTVLGRHETTLELVRCGAREPRCDWSQLRVPPATRASADAEAPAATTPAAAAGAADDAHDVRTALSGAELVMLTALRARQLIERGQPGEAVMWLADGLAVARQMTDTSDFGQFHLAVLLERAAIKAIAENLLDVPPPQLGQLKARLASLPPPRRLQNVMRPAVKEAERNVKRFGALKANTPPSTSATQLAKTLADSAAGQRAVLEVMSVPPDEARERLDAALKPLDEDDKRLWRSMADRVLKLRVVEAPLEAQRPMLNAAVDVALHGRDALRATQDPFGGGAAFDYRRVGNGFQLFSRLTVHREPISLEVGHVDATPP